MNQEQFLGVVRVVLPVLLSYAAGAKWIDIGDVTQVTAAIVTLAAVAWTIFAHAKSNMVKTVAALPEVAQVEVHPTHEGIELRKAAGSTPNARVVVANGSRM